MRIMNMLDDHMESNSEIVNQIKSNKNYAYLSGNNLKQEYLATIAGFRDVHEVNNFLTYNYGENVADKRSSSIFQKIREFFKHFDNFLKRDVFSRFNKSKLGQLANLDLNFASIEDIITAITMDAINGDSIFTEDEGLKLYELMRSDKQLKTKTFNSYPLTGMSSIENISDLDQYFTKDALGLNIEDEFGTKRQRAEFFYHHMKNDEQGNYIYYKKKRYNFRSGDAETIISDIEKTLLPVIDKFNDRSKKKIDTFVKTVRTDNQFNSAAAKLLSNDKLHFTNSSLKKIYNLSGIASGVQDVIKYSELRTSKIPELRALYNSSFFENNDFDPYVIVNRMSSGSIYISLMDITFQPLNKRNTYIDNNNLLGNIMSDREYTERGGKLTNKTIGIRKFKLGLLAAHLMKSNNNIVINNLSVFGTPNNSMNYAIVSNIANILGDLKIVGETEDIMNNINDNYIKRLLTDEELLSKESEVSTLELIANHLDDKSKLKGILDDATKALIGGRFAEYDKTDMINAIGVTMRNLEREGKKDSELYRLLSMTILEYQALGKPSDFMTNVSDMIWGSRMSKTSWNIAEPVAQLVVNQYMKAKTAILNNMKSAYAEIRKARDAYYNKAKMSPNSKFIQSKIFNASSKIFEKLCQEHTVILNKNVNGVNVKSRIKVRLPFLLNTESNDSTIKDYALGVKKIVEDEMKKTIRYEMIKSGQAVTDKKVEDKFKSLQNIHDYGKFNGFYMPVILKSQAELLMKGINDKLKGDKSSTSINDAIDRFLKESGNEHNMFIDSASEDEANNVHSKFKKQMGDFRYVLKESGMMINSDGDLEIIDENKFNSISTNIEMAMASFVLSNSRSRIFESQFLPVYNAGITIIKAKGIKSKGNPNAYKNTIAWLEQYLQVLVDRKSPDMENPSKLYRRFSRFTRASINLFTNSVIGASVKVGVKSALLLEMHAGITALSHSMAKIGLTEEQKKTADLEFISAKNLSKAHMWFNGYRGFGWTLARKLQQIDSQEMDILNSYVYTKTSRHAVNPGVLHLPNKLGDDQGRIIHLVAYLQQRGSLDAYSYDNKTGEISYDETKDKYFYNESGTIKPEMKAIREQIWQDNVDTGLQDPEVKELQLGMSYKGMNQVKSIVDRWVIGSMSEDTRWQLNNYAAGKLATTFRVFADEKLFRAGLFADTRNTSLGTGYKTYVDKYGNELTHHDIKVIEGTFQSVTAFFKELAKLKNADMKKFWQEAPHERRVNLTRTLNRGAMFLLLMLLFKFAVPDDEDEEDRANAMVRYQRHYRFLYQDMLDLFTLSEVSRSPIPIIQTYETLGQIVFGDGEWKQMLRFLPGVTSGEWMSESKEFIQAEMSEDPNEAFTEIKEEEKAEEENND